MKKFALSLGVLIMTISLVACGNGSSAKKSSVSSPFTMSKVNSKGILTAKAYDVDEDGGYYSLSGKAEPGETVVLLVSYDDYTEKNPTASEEMRTNADKNGNWEFDDYLVTSTDDKSDKYQVAAVTTDKKVVNVGKKRRGDKDFYINDLTRKIKFLAPTFKETPNPSSSSSKSKASSSSKSSSSSSSSATSSSYSKTPTVSSNSNPVEKPVTPANHNLQSISKKVRDDDFSGAAIVNGTLTLILRDSVALNGIAGTESQQAVTLVKIMNAVNKVRNDALAKNGVLVTGAYYENDDNGKNPAIIIFYNHSSLQNQVFSQGLKNMDDPLQAIKIASSSYVDAVFLNSTSGLGIFPKNLLRVNLDQNYWLLSIETYEKQIKPNRTIELPVSED